MSSRAENKIIDLLTFVILYVSISYFCKNVTSESINVGFCLVAIFCSIPFVRMKIGIKKSDLVFFLILSLLGCISSIYSGDEFKFIAFPIIQMWIALMFVSIIPFDKFKKSFVKVISFVSLFSIFCLGCYSLFPSIFDIFPETYNSVGYSAYNLFFVVIPTDGLIRLQGFAWEPGAFQTLINIALFFLIAENNWSKDNKIKLMILFIALLLSLSTTGYIVGLINIALLLMRNYDGKFNGNIKIGLSILVIVLVLFIISPFIPNQIGGVTFGVEKINRFLQGTSYNGYDSSSVRYDSIYYPTLAFLQNPVLGVGYNGLQNLHYIVGHSMLTCTPINYFAMYGILYGILIMKCLYNFCKLLSQYRIIILTFFIALLLTIISEQYVNYLFMDIIIFYGLTTYKFQTKQLEA